jgi:hypothetical protein
MGNYILESLGVGFAVVLLAQLFVSYFAPGLITRSPAVYGGVGYSGFFVPTMITGMSNGRSRISSSFRTAQPTENPAAWNAAYIGSRLLWCGPSFGILMWNSDQTNPMRGSESTISMSAILRASPICIANRMVSKSAIAVMQTLLTFPRSVCNTSNWALVTARGAICFSNSTRAKSALAACSTASLNSSVTRPSSAIAPSAIPLATQAILWASSSLEFDLRVNSPEHRDALKANQISPATPIATNKSAKTGPQWPRFVPSGNRRYASHTSTLTPTKTPAPKNSVIFSKIDIATSRMWSFAFITPFFKGRANSNALTAIIVGVIFWSLAFVLLVEFVK